MNKADLESFLGLIIFIGNICIGSQIPLPVCMEKEDLFQKLKEAITEAPLLVFPNEGDGFVLYTDASEKAIGTYFLQV